MQDAQVTKSLVVDSFDCLWCVCDWYLFCNTVLCVLFRAEEERAGCFTLIVTCVLIAIVICPVGWSVVCE